MAFAIPFTAILRADDYRERVAAQQVMSGCQQSAAVSDGEETAFPRPLRVAFLFGHLHRGGMQRAVANLTRALPPEVESFVVYFGTDEPGFDFRATMVDLAVPGVLGAWLPRKLLNFASRSARLRRFVARQGVDVVVSMGEIANALNAIGNARRRILSVRSAPTASLIDSGAYAPIYAAFRRRLYGRAEAIVAVSEAIGEELQTRYDVPRRLIRVIPNLYDATEIQRAASEQLPADLDWLAARQFVAAVGTIAAHKGQAELVRALASARRAAPELELVLVGDGEGRQAIMSLVTELGLEGSVHLVGFRTNPHAIIARALAVVLPSHFEGFPNALVEAMLCAVPVVATDCATGPREILGDSEHGLLVPAITEVGEAAVVRGLAEAIASIARDPALRARLARAALSRGRDFDAERIVGAWLTVLGEGRAKSGSGR